MEKNVKSSKPISRRRFEIHVALPSKLTVTVVDAVLERTPAHLGTPELVQMTKPAVQSVLRQAAMVTQLQHIVAAEQARATCGSPPVRTLHEATQMRDLSETLEMRDPRVGALSSGTNSREAHAEVPTGKYEVGTPPVQLGAAYVVGVEGKTSGLQQLLPLPPPHRVGYRAVDEGFRAAD